MTVILCRHSYSSAAELALPDITAAEGAELVSLARSAMNEYLFHRTSAAEISIPDSLERLKDLKLSAVVTLRENGVVVARSIKSGGTATMNVISAALDAMRSPQLPDRVTQAFLESLLVEVEVLGEPRSVDSGDVVKFIDPGLAGLILVRNSQRAYALASDAYESGLSAEQMMRYCRGQIAMNPAAVAAQPQWNVFSAKHFSGWPDGTTVSLYRGKILIPREEINEQLISDAARRVGMYLVHMQDKEGVFRVGELEPSLAENLRVAYAVSLLAEKTQDNIFANAANAALSHAAGFARQHGDGFILETANPDQQLAAAAWMLMAADTLSNDSGGEEMRDKLAGAIFGTIEEGRLPPRRLDGSADEQASLRDACVAYLALAGSGNVPAEKLAMLKEAIAAATAEDCEATLWRLRVIGADAGSVGELSKYRSGDDSPADERGGFGEAGEVPKTSLTALAPLSMPAGEATDDDFRRDAVAFIVQMIFTPREAYFVADPAAMDGAVRVSPTAAAVSLDACAAAIEALISVQ